MGHLLKLKLINGTHILDELKTKKLKLLIHLIYTIGRLNKNNRPKNLLLPLHSTN